jgi:prophage regulatory protein
MNRSASSPVVAAQLTNATRQDSPTIIGSRPPRPMRVLRLGQVLDMTGLSKTTIYKLQAEGGFPLRMKITTHCVGWIENEVQSWVETRLRLGLKSEINDSQSTASPVKAR